jgi:26S proteasome regulatory subunit N8
VGWYITGTKFKKHDVEIHEIMATYCKQPILVLIDAQNSDELRLPTEAYASKNEVKQDGTQVKNFMHIPSSVEAFEAEEVGVEHLLREIKDVTTGELGTQVSQKLKSL